MNELINSLFKEHQVWFNVITTIIQLGFLGLTIAFSLINFSWSKKEKNAMLWLQLHDRFMNFLNLYTKLGLRPALAVKDETPKYNVVALDLSEKSQLAEYLGLFELCEQLIESKLINKDFFMRSYSKQIGEIINHPAVKDFIDQDRDNWTDLEKLRHRLDKH